jgi:hypothetical protein
MLCGIRLSHCWVERKFCVPWRWCEDDWDTYSIGSQFHVRLFKKKKIRLLSTCSFLSFWFLFFSFLTSFVLLFLFILISMFVSLFLPSHFFSILSFLFFSSYFFNSSFRFYFFILCSIICFCIFRNMAIQRKFLTLSPRKETPLSGSIPGAMQFSAK